MMLINLLNNAIKYNKSEKPVVRISFEPKGRHLHIKFADNGIGLPPKETKKIFRNSTKSAKPMICRPRAPAWVSIW